MVGICHSYLTWLWEFAEAICHENLPQQFAVGISHSYLPWEFAAVICHGLLLREFAVAICHSLFAMDLFCVCKKTFFLCDFSMNNSFYVGHPPLCVTFLSVHCTPFFRNSISSNHNFWYTCVK